MMVEWSMLFFFAVSSIVEMEANRFIPSNFLKHFETDWRIFDGLKLRSDSNAKLRIRIVMRRFWKCEGFPAMPCHIRTCINQKKNFLRILWLSSQAILSSLLVLSVLPDRFFILERDRNKPVHCSLLHLHRRSRIDSCRLHLRMAQY